MEWWFGCTALTPSEKWRKNERKKCRIDFSPPRGSWLTGYCEKTPSWRLFFLSFKSNLVSPGAKINHARPWQAHGDVHVSQPPWLVVAMWTVMGADRGWEEGVGGVKWGCGGESVRSDMTTGAATAGWWGTADAKHSSVLDRQNSSVSQTPSDRPESTRPFVFFTIYLVVFLLQKLLFQSIFFFCFTYRSYNSFFLRFFQVLHHFHFNLLYFRWKSHSSNLKKHKLWKITSWALACVVVYSGQICPRVKSCAKMMQENTFCWQSCVDFELMCGREIQS